MYFSSAIKRRSTTPISSLNNNIKRSRSADSRSSPLHNLNLMHLSLFSLDNESPAVIKVDYSLMLSHLMENLQQSPTNTMSNKKYFKIQISSNQQISLPFPHSFNLNSWFSETNFAANWACAFGRSLDMCTLTHMHNTKIKFKIQCKSTAQKPSVEPDPFHLTYFRLLVCICFGILFNIHISECACFPQTETELVLLDRGLYTNCLKSLQCNLFLAENPGFYDQRIMGPCNPDQNIISAAVNAMISGLGNNLSLMFKQS